MKILEHNSFEFIQHLDRVKQDLESFGFDAIMPIPLVLDKLNRNEMMVILSDSSNYIIGYPYVNGVTRSFHLFWCAGQTVINDFERVSSLIKELTLSKKITLVANSEAHSRLYSKIFSAYNPHKSYHFSIDI